MLHGKGISFPQQRRSAGLGEGGGSAASNIGDQNGACACDGHFGLQVIGIGPDGIGSDVLGTDPRLATVA